MDHLHTQGQEVYMHCLTKLRNNQLKASLQEQCSVDQLKYGYYISYLGTFFSPLN